MYYDSEELKRIFDANKKVFDSAYKTTKAAYDDEQANVAMYEYLCNWETKFITRKNNARNNLKGFEYHGNEVYQFLIDYAMSSYISNSNVSEVEDINNPFKVNCELTFSDIRNYVKTADKSLKYDRNSVITAVALGGAWSPYWMVDLLACNHKLREKLVEYLIEERYIANRGEKLDNSKRIKRVRTKDGKEITILKDRLNRDIDNMIRDGDSSYYFNAQSEEQLQSGHHR